MLATIRDDTQNVLSMQDIIPNSKDGIIHGHHLQKAPNTPHPHPR